MTQWVISNNLPFTEFIKNEGKRLNCSNFPALIVVKELSVTTWLSVKQMVKCSSCRPASKRKVMEEINTPEGAGARPTCTPEPASAPPRSWTTLKVSEAGVQRKRGQLSAYYKLGTLFSAAEASACFHYSQISFALASLSNRREEETLKVGFSFSLLSFHTSSLIGS